MKNKIKKTVFVSIISVIVFSFMLMPLITNAALPAAKKSTITDVASLYEKLENIIDYFQAFVLLIGILMIIWAGYTWMTAGGDAEKLGEARSRLVWGLVGIGVAVLAYGIDKVVVGLLQ